MGTDVPDLTAELDEAEEIVMGREISEEDAQARITAALEMLDDEARSRVLRYMAERFGVPGEH